VYIRFICLHANKYTYKHTGILAYVYKYRHTYSNLTHKSDHYGADILSVLHTLNHTYFYKIFSTLANEIVFKFDACEQPIMLPLQDIDLDFPRRQYFHILRALSIVKSTAMSFICASKRQLLMSVKVPTFSAVNYMLAQRSGHYCQYDCLCKHEMLCGLYFKVWFFAILASGFLTM
jgi:hypothetical protein